MNPRHSIVGVKVISLLEEALYLDKLNITYWGVNAEDQLGIDGATATGSNSPVGVHCP